MEDVEDESQIDDDKWDNMEFKDNMEHMVDMYSSLLIKITKLILFHRPSLSEAEVQLLSSSASPAFLSIHEI